MSWQSFTSERASHDEIAARVENLRVRLAQSGLDGVVVPHEDAYQSEYLPPSEERLRYITGFTGSAGRAVVLADAALFATDGRYALQAGDEVPSPPFDVVHEEEAASDWLAARLAGKRIAVDTNLHTRADLERLERRAKGVRLERLAAHPLDALWQDRPAPPSAAVRAHPAALAGRSASDKIADLRSGLTTDGLFVPGSDDVSWLFNWRGGDVAHTPLVLSQAFVPREGPVTLFVEPGKLSLDLLAPFGDTLAVVSPADMLAELARLSAGLRIAADPARATEAALAAIEKDGTLVPIADPVIAAKAVKNAAEIAGMRAAHHADGLAMVRFLAWFDAHGIGSNEIALVQRLEALRAEAGAFDTSFDTIAGAGENGAIVHYRVDEVSNRTIADGEPVLIDSGGQYPSGTTDITRTMVAGGRPGPDAFRVAYTRVLKGHIAIARAHFPAGTTGAQLDPFARAALWQAGSDYAHGTGHGIGAALGVHEAGCGLSKRSTGALAPGMIVSNEPGAYVPNAFGVRLENLCLVREAADIPGGERPMLSFETLTLAPFDTRPVLPTLMSAAELGWLDAYHARVHGALVADLDAHERAWLAARTRPIG